MKAFLIMFILTFRVLLSTASTESVDTLNQEQNLDCQCVPYYQCKNYSNSVESLIGFRGDEKCANYLEVCCKPDNLNSKFQITTTASLRKDCGYSNPNGIGFHRLPESESNTLYAEFPWMVAVLAVKNNTENKTINVYKCGGTLINPLAVLTAGHCVSHRANVYRIRAGEWDSQTDTEMFPHQTRDVEKIIIHENFENRSNDIAILVLDAPLKSADNIGVVCLPHQDVVIPATSRCYATGWGKDKPGLAGKHQLILKKIDLPIVDRDTCQNKLRTTDLGKDFVLDKNLICAGGEQEKGTCEGDDGGPLLCAIVGEKNRYELIGIIGKDVACGQNQTPGLYLNVATFRKWIDEEMKKEDLDTSIYTRNK